MTESWQRDLDKRDAEEDKQEKAGEHLDSVDRLLDDFVEHLNKLNAFVQEVEESVDEYQTEVFHYPELDNISRNDEIKKVEAIIELLKGIKDK